MTLRLHLFVSNGDSGNKVVMYKRVDAKILSRSPRDGKVP